MDKTGYRCNSGTSINIFYTKEECVKCYREQVRQASEIYEREKARIIADFDKRMVELDKSLEPFEDIPKSDYTVVAKMDVTNDSLGYNEKNRHFLSRDGPNHDSDSLYHRNAQDAGTDWPGG